MPVLALFGCIAEVAGPASTDDEAVLDHVEALGYARDAAQLRGDDVLVEGDLLFDREGLVQGAYERYVPESAEGWVEKGYRYPNSITSAYRGNIQLRFATGKWAPNKALRDGFVAAAKAWSAIPGSSIRISPSNTGPAITVHMLSVAEWDDPDGVCPETDACSRIPRDGRPGRDIYVRARSKAGDCGAWGGTNLINVTRHELGHTLGFAHPMQAGSRVVAGTRACVHDTEEECADDPGYATIMGGTSVERGCVVSPARLTKDDYATCATRYPAPK
jgi:hypothetical protein